jgi:hypothetical protein
MSNIAPTKSNLLKLKDELKFASLGYDLLDQKRNILVLELLHLVDQAVDYQSRVEKSLAEAYAALRRASMDMGKLQVARITRAINVESSISIKQRRVMGVQLPVVETEYVDHSPYFSPTETSFWVDGALKEFKKVLEMMRDYYDQEIGKWKQEAVATGQYQEFGTLFDRHISWDDKKELIPKSFWKGYSNARERIAYEGDPGDYHEVVKHAEK